MTIRLKNGLTDQVRQLAQMFGGDISSRISRRSSLPPAPARAEGLRMHLSDALGWIRVSGPKEKVEEFAALVKELDVQPANVELTFYLVVARNQARFEEWIPPAISPAIQ